MRLAALQRLTQCGTRLRFLQIAEVIEETLTRLPEQRVHSFESLAQADAQARRVTGELVEALAPA